MRYEAKELHVYITDSYGDDNRRIAICPTYLEARYVARALNNLSNLNNMKNYELSNTDALARDYYASGRKLKIQYLNSYREWVNAEDPSFHKLYEWRIKSKSYVVYQDKENDVFFTVKEEGIEMDTTKWKKVNEFTL